MQCPLCQPENLPSAASCTKCSTPLPLSDQTLDGAVSGGTPSVGTTPGGTSAWSIAVTPPPDAPYAQGEELVGTLLAERYEILELRSEEHTSELQSHLNLVCRLLLEKKKTCYNPHVTTLKYIQ